MLNQKKCITFRLEGKDLETLYQRAEEHNMKPSIFARMLVVFSMSNPTQEEINDRFDALEAKIEEQGDSFLQIIKGIFCGLEVLTPAQFDQVLKRIVEERSN